MLFHNLLSVVQCSRTGGGRHKIDVSQWIGKLQLSNNHVHVPLAIRYSLLTTPINAIFHVYTVQGKNMSWATSTCLTTMWTLGWMMWASESQTKWKPILISAVVLIMSVHIDWVTSWWIQWNFPKDVLFMSQSPLDRSIQSNFRREDTSEQRPLFSLRRLSNICLVYPPSMI